MKNEAKPFLLNRHVSFNLREHFYWNAKHKLLLIELFSGIYALVFLTQMV
jgi:hypothetical protein